ncbi:MAG: HlyC/CorC family transporter [Armatimonadetes bacterium]|nr:HlyC/CorC family transporter [Armatimonadota bacterium]
MNQIVAITILFGVPAMVLAQGDKLPLSEASEIALVPSIAAIVLFVALNAVFSAAWSSLEFLRPSHLRSSERTDKEIEVLNWLLANKPQALAGLTLCRQTISWWVVMLSLIPAYAVTTHYVKEDSSPTLWLVLFFWLGIAIPIAGINMIIGELAPRAYAALRPAQVAYRLRKLILLTSGLFYFPAKLLVLSANLVTRRFGAQASFVVSNHTEEEIKSLAETGQESGEIEPQERQLLHSVFEFGDTIAREIMTPRVDMDAAPVNSTLEDLVKLVTETGHSRIPVYIDTDDQIIGLIHAKDLLEARLQPEKPVNLRTMIRPVVFVPENKNIGDLLAELRSNRSQMAIVQDEFGGTAGLVTIEDIVEELVGEIVDEYDRETAAIVKNGVGWIVSGKVNIYDLNAAVGSDFESDEFDTIAGYVFGLFGRQPKIGDSVEDDQYRFLVEETDGRRIRTLHVMPLNEESEKIEVV